LILVVSTTHIITAEFLCCLVSKDAKESCPLLANRLEMNVQVTVRPSDAGNDSCCVGQVAWTCHARSVQKIQPTEACSGARRAKTMLVPAKQWFQSLWFASPIPVTSGHAVFVPEDHCAHPLGRQHGRRSWLPLKMQCQHQHGHPHQKFLPQPMQIGLQRTPVSLGCNYHGLVHHLMAGSHVQTAVDDQTETCVMPHWASEMLSVIAFAAAALAADPVC